ncbi:riboflavin biosynthesis protein RibF [Parabacteroides sp. AM08-6]|uniref:riboflavin biosynthesis protein RibF n=1 Tax=Parabacteroides sp. AM08-6 TaxID=2292053 RepID=UPI000EFF2731|nr:riboflavin biosynthesis protein RibF [Parabacteroides sp. AM08-6]RHJ80998.1 riboflavin biosynthesis protein RibF [Parabacteroides sp. AM08-6]
MIVVRDTDMLKGKGLVASIGFFDGVHRGHRFLIGELKQLAALSGLPSAVITFPEHPRAVLHSDYQPKLLNSFEEKLEHLASTGIDYCIVLNFTAELARLTAKEFITSILAEKLHVETLLIGYDHRFGHNRKDGFEEYVVYGEACGVQVVKAARYSEGEAAVSSSKIRGLLSECRVEEAAHLLTYPYQLKGTIVSGYKVGRKLGFPTANIQVDEPFKILPGIGVYAVWVHLNGKRYKGMLYIGDRPTLNNGSNITLEVNILDFAGDIYNNEITVAFIYHVRGDVKFDSLDELVAQLGRDRETVNNLLKE